MLISGLKTSDNEHKVDMLKVEEEFQNSNIEAKNILAPLCIPQIPQEPPKTVSKYTLGKVGSCTHPGVALSNCLN